MQIRLGEISERIGAELRGDPDRKISGVGTLKGAAPDEITFLANPRYAPFLPESQAAAIILHPRQADMCNGDAVLSENPYLAFARAAALFDWRTRFEPGISSQAIIHPDASVATEVAISAGVVVEAGAVIESAVTLGPNTVVSRNAIVGNGTRLVGQVHIGEDVRIGKRCLVHPGVVIGADGFGQARDGESWVKVPQLGTVVIGDDVEIGANTTIDRGAIGNTVIGNGVRLDNQIQVAHNVEIGEHTAIAGCTAIAGSAVIGKRCMIAGMVGITGHLEIADDVTVLAFTLVTHSIRTAGTYSGSHPMEEVTRWRRNAARIRQLDDLARRVKELEKKSGKSK